MEITSASQGLQEQDKLIATLESQGDWDIIIGDAFVRGMRDIGYKSTSFALAEVIDNAIQASASQVDIVFGFDAGAVPKRLAVIDNGHGMKRLMTRASLIWGAGTRAGNQSGFGKYGYGLPTASVSQCHRVEVYSKVSAENWHRAYLDIDEIKDGKWTHGNRLEMPETTPKAPPSFVVEFLSKAGRWDDFDHGTVVLWDGELDRVDPKQRDKLRDSLVRNLGVIYRNYLVQTPMTVDGVQVQPCDPLFLTEGFRGYDLDEDRAQPLPPAVVEVKDKETGKALGKIRVRFARMPATFFRKPEYKHTNRPGRGKESFNERLEIADANNGVIFCREGRQIEVLRPPRSITYMNATTDRFWAVEVDFDATLDDYFAITTSKQQVRPDDRIWDMLKDKANLLNNISTMRGAYQKDANMVAAKAEKATQAKVASVAAIEAAAKFRTSKPPQETPGRSREAGENLDQEARRRADRAGLEPAVVQRELAAQQEGNPHAVEVEDLPDAPFFRCVQRGGQRVLQINVAHPFCSELYNGPGSTPRLRAGLEVLLWTLGEAEVDAEPDSDRRRFYTRERASVWSPYLADALTELNQQPLMQADEAPAA